MATYTAGDQINGALRLIGQLAEAEEPSAATAQDALTSLNQMIDSWSTERLAVFTTQEQVFSWLPGFIKRLRVCASSTQDLHAVIFVKAYKAENRHAYQAFPVWGSMRRTWYR